VKKKIILVLAVLLTSAAALSLILAISRYVGFLKDPEAWRDRFAYRVEPSEQVTGEVKVRVLALGGATGEVAALLTSTFWIFEVRVDNESDRPVDVDFDRVTLRVGEREVRSLTTDGVIRLFNERMAGAFTSAAARRGHRQALDQLEGRKLEISRVFPGYHRESLVFFQPHPDLPEQVEMTFLGLRQAGGGELAPLTFHVYQLSQLRAR